MLTSSTHIFLADDDKDDCFLFREALDELGLNIHLTTINNGDELLNILNHATTHLPAAISLDLNMPRKNGYECLAELKGQEQLKDIPVIIYSTSYDTAVANFLYSEGAVEYIRKPSAFAELKEAILRTLTSTLTGIQLT